MGLYEQLTPVRTEPRVWISRIVILERLTPTPVTIRDIPLTRGLNIIWAEESEDDESAAEISGHSAGKTTFCRFLRYVLGERTFGTKVNMDLIRGEFPHGYVAAELHVSGSHWAVRRPFGSGRMSYIKENSSIEELLNQATGAVSQDEYPLKLGLDSLVDEMETGAVVRTGEAIEWGHILAWCTRDQEARFQNVYDWRSPRSESDAPTFRYSKAGPLFVMRAALGLFLPDELKGEENLAELQRKKERLEKEIDETRREPQFRVNLYDHELRRRLSALLPGEPGVADRPLHSQELLPDLDRLTEQAIDTIARRGEEHLSLIKQLQEQLDAVGARNRECENELERLDALFDLSATASKELDGGLSTRQELRQQIQEYHDSMCPFGGVLISDCSYVVDRQTTLRFSELQDARAMKNAETRRQEERHRIERTKSDLRADIARLHGRRVELQTQRDAAEIEFRKEHRELHDLKQVRDSLEDWTKRRDEGTGYDALVALRRQIDDTNRQIEEIDRELTELLRSHDNNRERLTKLFSSAVRSVLSSNGYDGVVSMDDRELAFRITHGPALGGEAVGTLSVLLADIATLTYHTVSDKSCLPGFLVHDSPREADLGIRIYLGFIRLVASLHKSFGEEAKCPFQYILTTTTAPPKELRKPQFVKLHLNATNAEELLLRRNVAASATRDDNTLFPEGEHDTL